MYSSTLSLTSVLVEVGGQGHVRPFYPRERGPLPVVQEAVWASAPVWTGAENLTPTGFNPTNLPSRSKSLYRLCCPIPTVIYGNIKLHQM
jgi:hypothetical protein